ncbi:pseudouridine synthase [Candidatus Contubernalis alkaliaceticus]|uniref:pseudouridine synthase n=1 Tax=Candidatus Contubernalis alkaliaceticus TaxID=338645 RepID=UPI00240A2100|nr:pseudouridine synthase [Candidatus Contubernalis alkalaceticus]
MRLQKYLALAGVASRRASEELIKKGQVKVNNRVITTLGIKINPEVDVVKVDDTPVLYKEKKVYLLLNKPKGYITSVNDPHNRPTVMDLIPGIKERLYPVGRLDLDTEGLLLLTNDGQLAYRITHPKYKIDKKYLVKTVGIPSPEKIKSLEKGVLLTEGKTSPARVRIIKVESSRRWAWVEIIIHEGRKRQVRRMFELVGNPVTRLERIQLSFLTLEGLKTGQYRHLTLEEIRLLKRELGILG